ncbi:hypothetical protein [Pacificimonas flava]|nr:hypothetical protein [Pacificimonas flava]MBB5279679.1 hypothetical protein [Pacificimonas flava]
MAKSQSAENDDAKRDMLQRPEASGREPERQEAAREDAEPEMQRGKPGDIAAEEYRRGYETSDVSPHGVVAAGAGLLALMAVTALVVAWLLSYDRHRERPSGPALAERPLVQKPADFEVPPGWADLRVQVPGYRGPQETPRNAGTRIERAMAELAADGWPSPDAGTLVRPDEVGPAQMLPKTRRDMTEPPPAALRVEDAQPGTSWER